MRSRRSALVVLALVVLALVVGMLASTPAGSASQGHPRSEVDRRLSQSECRLLGRVFVEGRGCSRRECVPPAVLAKALVDTEVCALPHQGDFAFAAAIESRRCGALHRRWIAAVNWCSANPDRRSVVLPRAAQCVAPFTTYVNHRETEGYYDECLRPSRVRVLARIARKEGVSLRRVASDRSAVSCRYRPRSAFKHGRCVASSDMGPGGTLLIGDSLAYRGTDELSAIQPTWAIDGFPGRSYPQLAGRLAFYLADHTAPEGLILELGTNPSSGFSSQELRDVLESVPAPTPLMLVLPYRFARSRRHVAPFTRRYARWMRAVASGRGDSCVADWPGAVRHHPDTLVDGVHATPQGETFWASWVVRQWQGCSGSPASR